MKVAAIIPARYASSRFPGKPLARLLGKPMVIWVAEAAAATIGKNNVYIATDDNRIRVAAEEHRFNVVMTPSDILTGTDRVAYASKGIFADIYLNIQGDEPLLDPKSILTVIDQKKASPEFVINAMAKISIEDDPGSVNLPKVVFNEKLQLIYMSRLPIPGSKKGLLDNQARYKQICIYAFDRGQLEKFYQFGRKGALEEVEDIEILRFLELGIPVRMCEVAGGALAVDIPEDVIKVEVALKKMMVNVR